MTRSRFVADLVPVGDEDGDTLNAARVAELCCADWGLCRTITQNLLACRAFAETYDVPDREVVEERLDALLAEIELKAGRGQPAARGCAVPAASWPSPHLAIGNCWVA